MIREPYWQTDRATLWHGDCLDVLRTLADASVDAVVTDPPYSSGGMFRGDRTHSTRDKYQSSDVRTELACFSGDNRDQRSFGYWCTLWLSECRRVCKPGGMLCVFTDWRQLPTVSDMVQAGGWVWRGVTPWDKVQARPVPWRFRAQAEYMLWATNGPRDATPTDDAVYGRGIITVNTVHSGERDHSTQKPVELMEEVIRVTCRPGGVILDPFSGSGTTGVAALRCGMRFVGVELEAHFAEVSARRLAEVSGMPDFAKATEDGPGLFGGVA